jgi:hypothetical protein
MTQYELKTALIDILKTKVDSDIIYVGMGTADSAQRFRLENSSGCILIGSGGANRFNPRAMPNENSPAKIDYKAGIQIVASIGYQTINSNIEELDALEEIVFNTLTNLVLTGLSYPIIPLRINPTFTRKGVLWTVLAFEAISLKRIAIHSN